MLPVRISDRRGHGSARWSSLDWRGDGGGRSDHIILLLNGTQKKTNALDRKLIEKALEPREMWLAGKTALPFDTALRHGGLGTR